MQRLAEDYNTPFKLFERLIEDLGLRYDENQVITTASGGRLQVIQGENLLAYLVKMEATEPDKYSVSKSQWSHINQVEKRLIACGLTIDTGVDDKGRWIIRLEDNVMGADSVDFVFSAGSDIFTKLEINE